MNHHNGFKNIVSTIFVYNVRDTEDASYDAC
jgi:hypothetical protein